MTVMDQGTQLARRVDVRMVFGYVDQRDSLGNAYPFGLTDAIDNLSAIEDLFFLCAVSDWTGQSDMSAIDSPQTFVKNLHVRRLSYDSPFEVVLTFIAGVGAAARVATRLVDVWTNFQNARRITATTNAQVASLSVLTAAVEAPFPLEPNTLGQERFENAARVLRILSTLEVNEET